jgi:hypothetical protein
MNLQRNGISKIPGRYIIDAMDQLPPCGPGSTKQHRGVDVPLWGQFQVTFTPLKQTPRGWPPRWIWIAREAKQLDSSH